MTRFMVCVVLGLALSCGSRAHADDAVKETLDAAKAAYNKSMSDYRRDVDKWFTAEDDAARRLKTGASAKVKALAAERKEFDETGALPKRAPNTLKGRPAKITSTLSAAYTAAADAYTRGRKDDEAAAVEKELEAFRSGAATAVNDPRFEALFNGKNLDGWRPFPKDEGKWTVVDGVLVGSGGKGFLISENGKYADYTLRAEVMSSEDEDGGVFIRLPHADAKLGYEVDVTVGVSRPRESGSIRVYPTPTTGFIAVEVKNQVHKPDEWFTLTIVTKGPRITVTINDTVVSDFTDERRHFAAGHIGLQHHVPGKTIKFRKIEIAEADAK